MYFDSFADFLAMGGHGIYVWLSYGLMTALLALLILGSRWHQRRWLREQHRQAVRQQARRPADSPEPGPVPDNRN